MIVNASGGVVVRGHADGRSIYSIRETYEALRWVVARALRRRDRRRRHA